MFAAVSHSLRASMKIHVYLAGLRMNISHKAFLSSTSGIGTPRSSQSCSLSAHSWEKDSK